MSDLIKYEKIIGEEREYRQYGTDGELLYDTEQVQSYNQCLAEVKSKLPELVKLVREDVLKDAIKVCKCKKCVWEIKCIMPTSKQLINEIKRC